jgi:hypothetical protein
MSNTKFTQGEWIAVGAWVEVEDNEIADICSCNPASIGQDHLNRNHEEQIANANLIAAAPELLAALVKFVEGCDKAGLSDFNIKYLPEARAAIAKALGSW